MDKEELMKQRLIESLSIYDRSIIEMALYYAINMKMFGQDYTMKWETAVQQSEALSKAYMKGYMKADEQFRLWCKSCKERDKVKPFAMQKEGDV